MIGVFTRPVKGHASVLDESTPEVPIAETSPDARKIAAHELAQSLRRQRRRVLRRRLRPEYGQPAPRPA
jgi:hypothetical protein